MSVVYELNLDGLVGPTHHYAGLSYGNTASMTHANLVSNPKEAARQGLQKIRLLHSLGLKQAVLPPQLRPNLTFLHELGFTGSIANQLHQAKKENPRALSAAFSASSMWAANAATVAPSMDTKDHRVHFTAANLVHHLHRHQEAEANKHLFAAIFSNEKYFVHHDILPRTEAFNDEGAANHNRLVKTHDTSGLHLFVYNRKAFTDDIQTQFPARQTKEASEAVARKHLLDANQVVFVQQTPIAIDAGVFHNDVIALANESVFLVHQDAFINQAEILKKLRNQADFELNVIEIKRNMLSLKDAVQSYLFNSQLITLPNKKMALIAPEECQTISSVQQVIEGLIADQQNPIQSVHYVPLKQSMQNGGGPACLRLRVPLTEEELACMHQGVLVTDNLLDELEVIINKYYRSQLSFEDLTDPLLVEEALAAHDAFLKLMGVGA